MTAKEYLRMICPNYENVSYGCVMEIIDMAHQEALELVKEQLIKEGIDDLIKSLK